MGLYYIGKTQKNLNLIQNINWSHVIFGNNYENNFACLSQNDENKQISSKKMQIYYKDLRYGMETFKFLDKDAKFVLDDPNLLNELMKIEIENSLVSNKDIKLN